MNRTHQIIFCSDDIGRAFLATIAYTHTHAVVEDCEKLMPSYELALQRMRDPQEQVLKLENLQMDATKRRCPFCGNRGTFYCDCGTISCANPDKKIHECPNPDCTYVGGHQPIHCIPTSLSGFVDGPPSPRARLPVRQPAPAPRMTAIDWQKAKERQQRISAVTDRRTPALLPAPRNPGAVPLLPYYKK